MFRSCLGFLAMSLSLFGQTSQTLLLKHLDASHDILVNAPHVIEECVEGKLYLNESAIYDSFYLDLEDGRTLSLPERLQDSQGSYLVSHSSVAKKPFKLICNKCNHEWEGGVFTVYCPKCGSRDWRIVRND